MNAYKVWAEDLGYLIILAESRGQARASYVSDVSNAYTGDGEFTMPMHIHLIERNVECDSLNEYMKSREIDLMLAGIINPDWYELMMDCWDNWEGDA